MAYAGPPPRSLAMPPATLALRERVLLMVLFFSALLSSIAVIEPSPHDALMPVLGLACIVAGVRFDRRVTMMFLLLLLFNTGGLMSLLNVPGKEKTLQYAATSIYLALAAVMYACLFAEHTMQRIVVLRAGYILTAVFVSLTGIIAYFHLVPGTGDLFAPGGRALGTFKDPNVFGPFLIWPALVVLERMLARRIRWLDVAIVAVLLLGLLLSFSRGAWFHFVVSGVVTVALAFLTAPSPRARMRIFALSVTGIVALAAFIAILLSNHSVDNMFIERFHLFNSYDVGQGGRFRLQEIALSALLNFPNGMGPFEFSNIHGIQQHNVYLQAFLVYGWAGGMAYIMLLLATFWVALRNVFVRAPWQPYLICSLGAFLGEALEGFVIDSDHWRHFYLILGLIWGLAAASAHHRRAVQRSSGGSFNVHHA